MESVVLLASEGIASLSQQVDSALNIWLAMKIMEIDGVNSPLLKPRLIVPLLQRTLVGKEVQRWQRWQRISA
jgi:hypothetical protein